MLAAFLILGLVVGYIAGKVDAIFRLQKLVNSATPEQRETFHEMAKGL